MYKKKNFFLTCRKNTESKKPKFVKAKHGNIKKWKFFKQQEARRLLNKMNRKAPILSDLRIVKLLF